MTSIIRHTIHIAALCLLTSSAQAATSDLGVALGGQCVAGTCSALTLNTEPSEAIDFSRQIVLANGDLFGVTVQLTRDLQPLAAKRFIGVKYLGHVVNGSVANEASQSSALTIDVLRAWPADRSLLTTQVSGVLSDTLASGSSLVVKLGDPKARQWAPDEGVFNTPGAYSRTLQYPLSVVDGQAVSDIRYAFAFAQGSQVGSFITVGSPVPEPASLALIGLGLPVVLAMGRRSRASRMAD